MTQEKIYAIKGFDKTLKAGNTNFEVGKEYYTSDKPRIGYSGHVFYKTVSDCLKYCPNKDGNRYCLIEVKGDVDAGVERSSTNWVKIIRELNWAEVDPSIKQYRLTPEVLYQMCQKGFVIGGSMALKLYGYNLKRDITELDLITYVGNQSKDRETVNNTFKNLKAINRPSGLDTIGGYSGLFGEKYDIIQQPNEIRYAIRNVGGYDLKLQDENEIWQAKLKYALNGSIKHMNDIANCGIQFVKKTEVKQTYNNATNNDLPF